MDEDAQENLKNKNQR